jgi:hypothetical protein
MNAFINMLSLLNKEHEDVGVNEKIKRFNNKIHKEGGDIKNVIALCESLYDDLSRLNKQYPYLNDLLLSLIDILESSSRELKKTRKKNNALAHKNHELQETIDSVKIPPRIKCTTIIKGSYTINALPPDPEPEEED